MGWRTERADDVKTRLREMSMRSRDDEPATDVPPELLKKLRGSKELTVGELKKKADKWLR